jgi:hypothetical protein
LAASRHVTVQLAMAAPETWLLEGVPMLVSR